MVYIFFFFFFFFGSLICTGLIAPSSSLQPLRTITGEECETITGRNQTGFTKSEIGLIIQHQNKNHARDRLLYDRKGDCL